MISVTNDDQDTQRSEQESNKGDSKYSSLNRNVKREDMNMIVSNSEGDTTYLPIQRLVPNSHSIFWITHIQSVLT